MKKELVAKIVVGFFLVAGSCGTSIAQSFPDANLTCKPKKGATVKVKLVKGIGSVQFPHIFVGENMYVVSWVGDEAMRATAKDEQTHLLLRRDSLELFVLKDDKQTEKAKIIAEYKCTKQEIAL